MKKIRSIIIDILIIIVASCIYALSIHSFTAPNNIAPGGVTGLAIITNHLLGLPIGLLVTAVNIPLIIIGFKYLGKSMMIKTVISVIIFIVTVDYLFVNVPVYQGEKILAALFGGVLMGIGLALVYIREATTGGMDILNKLIQLKFPYIKLGQIAFATDTLVITIAVLVYGNLEAGLFAVITIFASSRMIDSFIYGMNESRLMLIISDSYEDITGKIIKMGRGVTLLNGRGVYTGKEKKVICCAVAKSEYFKIKRKVMEIDENAFIIITKAGEVFGEGFGNRLE